MDGAVRCSLGLAQTPGHLVTLERTGGQDGATALGGIQSQVVESKDLASGLGDAAQPLGCNSGRGCSPEEHT